MQFTIRRAKDADFAAAARLHRQTIKYINSRDYTPDIIRVWAAQTSAQKFRDSAKLCKRWVALDQGKIVGYCDHNFTCELWGLYIHKDYIGQGLGTQLLQTAEESMRQSGCKNIRIKSTISAMAFYQKNGYQVLKQDWHTIANHKLKIFLMSKSI